MYNVLLIDDNADHIELISSELMSSNRIDNLYVFYSGKEALNFLFSANRIKGKKSELLDFILLDLKMPAIDGFEVLQRVKKEPKFDQTPVIILSSSSSSDDMKRAKKLGAEGYIVKAFGSMQLFENICKIVPC